MRTETMGVTAIMYMSRSSSTSRSTARELEIVEQLRAAGFEPRVSRDRINCWTATMSEEGLEIFAATLEGLLDKATVALLARGLER